ncbi:MAG: ABC transporter ATP-binding protein [gamma proteobacterium symbiont of Bathyaustriella thionipta]|nr:ABC transporter ATP-binding protein [gamma proteobacterium symbiont of Bathyaustriella thionipta]
MADCQVDLDFSETSALLSVDALSQHYARHIAVDNLSFSLQKGEVVGFLGPNGAGKSTTMRMLVGAQAPSHGRVCIQGIDIQQDPMQAKACIGYLPESPPLYPELNVEEYLQFCARLHGIKTATAIKRALDRACERCGLQPVRHKLIRHLSKGYQQRTGIAQAILHEPQLIILDEPTVGLDPSQIRQIRALIRQLADHSGIILSTHILPEVQTVCSRVLILHQGRISYDAKLSEQQPRYRIQFSRELSAAESASLETLGESICQDNNSLLTPATEMDAGELLQQLVSNGLPVCTFNRDDAIENIYLQMTRGEVKA